LNIWVECFADRTFNEWLKNPNRSCRAIRYYLTHRMRARTSATLLAKPLYLPNVPVLSQYIAERFGVPMGISAQLILELHLPIIHPMLLNASMSASAKVKTCATGLP